MKFGKFNDSVTNEERDFISLICKDFKHNIVHYFHDVCGFLKLFAKGHRGTTSQYYQSHTGCGYCNGTFRHENNVNEWSFKTSLRMFPNCFSCHIRK